VGWFKLLLYSSETFFSSCPAAFTTFRNAVGAVCEEPGLLGWRILLGSHLFKGDEFI